MVIDPEEYDAKKRKFLASLCELRGYPGKFYRRKLLPDQEASGIHRRRSMPRCEKPTPPT